jgi:hypothetical protein
MVEFKDLIVGDSIFILESSSVLKFKILDLHIINDEYQLKLKGPDLTFKILLNKIKDITFKSKEEATATAVKHIYSEVNELIRKLSDAEMLDYIDLNNKLEIYKRLFPEIFI